MPTEKKEGPLPVAKSHKRAVPLRRREGGMPVRDAAFRTAVDKLVRETSQSLARWLEVVANGDKEQGVRADPARALEIVAKLAEYVAPKLSRVEMTGKDDGPINHIVRLSKADFADAIKEVSENI